MHTQLSHEEYLKLSERTMGTNFYLNNQSLINLLHSAIGTQTEVGELFEAFSEVEPEFAKDDIDAVNIVEEVSDVTWYLAIAHRELDINYEDLKLTIVPFDAEEFHTVLENLNIASSNFLDIIKKKAFYDKPINLDDVKKHLGIIYSDLHWLLLNFGEKTLAETRAVNINKLQARFPEKFTTENANNRNLEKERAILEGNVKSEEMGMGYL
jgi:NTP pyrophosphatase (non-canonical NTP hydrolase)